MKMTSSFKKIIQQPKQTGHYLRVGLLDEIFSSTLHCNEPNIITTISNLLNARLSMDTIEITATEVVRIIK